MLLFLFSCLLSGEPLEPDSYSVEWVEVGHRRSMNDIRESAVKIVMLNGEEELGHGTGGYFEYGKLNFILTAAHVVEGEMDIKIEDGPNRIGMRVVFVDFANDIAILKPDEKLQNVKPMKWKLNKSKNISGIDTYYSGFPSHYGNLLINGMVSSVTEEGVVIQSFALPGSSGSVVFDRHMRVIGVVSAVGLHMSQFSPYPSIQEDVVYVATASHLNIKRIIEVLECAE